MKHKILFISLFLGGIALTGITLASNGPVFFYGGASQQGTIKEGGNIQTAGSQIVLPHNIGTITTFQIQLEFTQGATSTISPRICTGGQPGNFIGCNNTISSNNDCDVQPPTPGIKTCEYTIDGGYDTNSVTTGTIVLAYQGNNNILQNIYLRGDTTNLNGDTRGYSLNTPIVVAPYIALWATTSTAAYTDPSVQFLFATTTLNFHITTSTVDCSAYSVGFFSSTTMDGLICGGKKILYDTATFLFVPTQGLSFVNSVIASSTQLFPFNLVFGTLYTIRNDINLTPTSSALTIPSIGGITSVTLISSSSLTNFIGSTGKNLFFTFIGYAVWLFVGLKIIKMLL